MKSIINKGIEYRFNILKKFQAGISLLGHEVKSIKTGKISMQGSFVRIKENEAWWTGADISPYQKNNLLAGANSDYNSKRDKKLLLHKEEIKQLIGALGEKGLTILPLRLYTQARKIKLEIGIARGLKKFDKRDKIKKKEYTRRRAKLLK